MSKSEAFLLKKSSSQQTVSSTSEPFLFFQNSQTSFKSIRSKRNSVNKNDRIPPSLFVRSKTSFGLHLLDGTCELFSNLSLYQSQQTLCSERNHHTDPLQNKTNTFLKEWSHPLFRLYFLMFLMTTSRQALWASFWFFYLFKKTIVFLLTIY
jgi:hypothetical protein